MIVASLPTQHQCAAWRSARASASTRRPGRTASRSLAWSHSAGRVSTGREKQFSLHQQSGAACSRRRQICAQGGARTMGVRGGFCWHEAGWSSAHGSLCKKRSSQERWGRPPSAVRADRAPEIARAESSGPRQRPAALDPVQRSSVSKSVCQTERRARQASIGRRGRVC